MNKRPNKRDRGDGGIALRFHTGRAEPASPHHGRSMKKIMIHRILALLLSLVALCSCDKAHERMAFPSRSMEPTIKAGSTVTVNKRAYEKSEPERFDLVVFTPPDEPESRYGFRIAGLPGESVEVTDEGLSINGKRTEHPEGIRFRPLAAGKPRAVKLGSTQFFVMGDNIGNARDSRIFGPIERSAIHGKITMIEQADAPKP